VHLTGVTAWFGGMLPECISQMSPPCFRCHPRAV